VPWTLMQPADCRRRACSLRKRNGVLQLPLVPERGVGGAGRTVRGAVSGGGIYAWASSAPLKCGGRRSVRSGGWVLPTARQGIPIATT
jgi:hypothetical protein